MDDSYGSYVQPPPPLTASGPTLLVSNTPESVASDGLLYAAHVAGPFRLFLHHANASEVERLFVVQLRPAPETTLRVARGPEGGLPVVVDTHPDVAGQAALAMALAGHQDTISLVSGSKFEETLMVPSGASISGWIDGDAGAGLDVAFAFGAMTGEDRPHVLEASGVTVRGTFPHADRQAIVHFEGGPQKIDLGSPRTGRFAFSWSGEFEPGVDATSGRAVWNDGNYGVRYDLDVSSAHPGSLYWNAAGGPSRFAIGCDGRVLLLDQLLAAHAGWNLGPLQPGQTRHLQLAIPGGSFAAGRLVFVPA